MKIYMILPEILNMSLTASVVIIAVLLARLLLSKAPRFFSYLLWGVVLFRLLCPFSFSSSFSALRAFPSAAEKNGSMEYIPQGTYITWQQENQPVQNGNMEQANTKKPAETQGQISNVNVPVKIGTYIWLLGIAVITGYSVVSYVQLKKKLATAVPVNKADRSGLDSGSRKKGYFPQNTGRIYETDYEAAPFVTGIFRPEIYLPVNLKEQEREYIILHEQTHIRRGDHIIKLISFLALTLHWFNPLVWLAFKLAERDMEMSCDESVMRHMPEDIRAEYSASLLEMAIGRTSGRRFSRGGIASGTPLAFGEGDVKERVRNIMKYKKPAAAAIAAAAVLVVLLAAVLVSNPDGKNKKDMLNNEKDAEQENAEAQENPDVQQNAGAQAVESQNLSGQQTDDSGVSASDQEERLRQVSELANQWAMAFCARDGAQIVSLSTRELQKELTEEGLLDTAGGSYSFGFSSPWPWEGIDAADVYHVTAEEARILYYAQVSDPHVTVWGETLRFSETEEGMRVSESEFHYYDAIASGEEFFSAYPEGIDAMMDYTVNEMGEALNNNAKDNRNSDFYADLFEPESAARFLLNLLDNPNKVALYPTSPREDGSRLVLIWFAEDGRSAAVKMIQPWGEDGIWIPQNYGDSLDGEDALYEYGIEVHYPPDEEDDYRDLETLTGDENFLETYYSLDYTVEADVSEKPGTETVEVYTGNIGDGDSGLVVIKDQQGNYLSSEFAHRARAGWNNVYLGKMGASTGASEYLLTVQIEDRDTYGQYTYRMYRLDENGTKKYMVSTAFSFGGAQEFIYEDALFEDWTAPMEYYLKNSYLLLSTQDGELNTSHRSDAEKWNYETLRR